MHALRQEDVAGRIGVTRQSVAKWEAGETIPDLEKSRLLAELFGVSLDELAGYDARSTESPGIPRKGRHIFGIVTVGDRGQIVIPAKARKVFDIRPGEQLMVLGDEAAGLAVIKTDCFPDIPDLIRIMADRK